MSAVAALEELQKEYERSPGNSEVLLRLAELYAASSRFHAAAKKVFDAAALIVSAQFASLAETASLVQKVESLIEQRRHNPEEVEDLRRFVSQLVDKHPDSPDLRKVLGDLRVLAGRPGFAVEQYRRALELGYEKPATLFNAYERKKDELAPDPVALDFFSELTASLKGASRDAAIRRVDSSTPVSELGALSEEAVEQIVQDHVQMGRSDEAIGILERLCLLESSPKHVHRIARILLDDGRPWEAYLRLKEVPTDIQSKQLMNEAATWLEKDEQYDQAVEVLRHVNDNDLVVLEASYLYEQQLELSSSLELADLNYKNGRKLDALRQYIGLIRSGMTDVSEFVGRLETIVESDLIIPLKDLLYLSEFFRDRGERFRAVRFLNKLFEWHPEPGEFEWQRISSLVETILAAEPTQPPLCLGLGQLCLRLGKMDRAIQEFILATGDPDLQQEANRALAQCYAQTGQYALALEKYRNVRLTPEDLQAIYDIVEPLEKSGADNDMLQALRLISDVDPAYMDVAQRLAKCERQSSPSVSLPSADPKMRALIGDLAIGRYRYVDKIGTGGMGVVYKVFDIKHNCIVAMKILRESLASSPKALTRFIREAQYVDQLNHPNIVHIFDFNISKIPGQSFIAMEYVDGPSMRVLQEDTFKENRSIDITYLQKILNYSAQICDAMAATHNEGIVHRDIKPDNIMSTKRGVVKITDFGILHHEEMVYTPTGAVIGTPRYMSPEQVQGDKVDGRSDIYAVGILLYEMLTGAPPFISGDIAFQQVNNPPQPPRGICPIISEGLQYIILKCLEKDPDLRYPSAKNLQEALLAELQAVGGTPPPTRSITGHRSTAEINRMTPFARPAIDAELDDDLDLS